MRYFLVVVTVLALLFSLGVVANAASVKDGFEGLPATYNLYMDPSCTAEITPAARLSGNNGLRLALNDSDNYARVKIDVSSLNLKLKDIFTATSWVKRVVGDANLPYFMFDVATPDPGSLVIQFSDITASNNVWTEKVMTNSSLVHVPQGRYNLLPGTFSSSNGGGTFAALCVLWGEYQVTHIRVGAGLWPSGGTVPYEAYVDDLNIRTRWCTISFTGADMFNYTTSVAARSAQDAPRRLRNWAGATLAVSSVDADSDGTNDFAEWAVGNLAGFGWSYFNLWGEALGPTSWGQPYQAVPSPLVSGGKDSWRNQKVNGVLVNPGMGSGVWDGGIVGANESPYNMTDHAWPVWRAPIGEQVTMANAASLRFSVDVLLDNPDTAFEPDGSLRVYFGGFNAPQGVEGQDVSGIILSPINRLSLVPTAESIYIQPGEGILVDMNVAGLQQMVTGCQAMLEYSSTYFDDPTGGCVAPGGLIWDQVIWDSWRDLPAGTTGEIDTAIGVLSGTTTGTDDDGRVAQITLTAKTNAPNGVTQMLFRTDDPDNGNKQTFLSDMSNQKVWPSKMNSVNITIDGTAPTVVLSDDHADAIVRDADTVVITATFTDANGIDEADAPKISIATGIVTNATMTKVSNLVWTYSWNVPAGNNGPATVSISAVDMAGNPNAAATGKTAYTIDNIAPSVTINQAVGQGDPTNDSPIDFTVVFSESVADFATGDVTVSSGTAVVSGGGTTYNVAVSGMDQGALIASIDAGRATDTAGNANTASTSTDNSVTYDNIEPTVTINQASGQGDPTNGSPIDFTVVFSESVDDFITGDVTVSSGTATVSGGGTTYNVAVTGMSQGALTASIDAGKATDAAGNANEASTSTDNSVTYDTVNPTIGITDDLGSNPVLQGTYTITVSAGDAAPSSGLVVPPVVKLDSNVLTAATGTGNGPWTYTVVVNASTANGAHSITADISDNAGNPATQATRAFTVNKNEINGIITSDFGGVGTRVVTFVLNGATTRTANVSSTGVYKLTNVADGVTAVSAKTAWTLRQKLTGLSAPLGQVTANFTLKGGDINGDNSINILDYSVLKTNWTGVPPATALPNNVANINGDNVVNVTDYNIMKGNWFQTGSLLP